MGILVILHVDSSTPPASFVAYRFSAFEKKKIHFKLYRLRHENSDYAYLTHLLAINVYILKIIRIFNFNKLCIYWYLSGVFNSFAFAHLCHFFQKFNKDNFLINSCIFWHSFIRLESVNNLTF